MRPDETDCYAGSPTSTGDSTFDVGHLPVQDSVERDVTDARQLRRFLL